MKTSTNIRKKQKPADNKQSNQEPVSFEKRQLSKLENYIGVINNDLDSVKNFQDSKNQSLFRLYLFGMRFHLSLKKYTHKSFLKSARPTKKSAPRPSRKSSPPSPPQRDSFKITPAWKKDPILFAQEALGIELFPHQQEFCLVKKRINILIAGRGAGKSVAAQVKAIHNACSHNSHTVLVVSSGQRMSSDFGTRLLDLVRESPLRGMTDSISSEQVRFCNGSVIKLLPANPDTIRGYHPKTGAHGGSMTVILDEACFMEQGDEIRKAVEYALITTPKDSGQLYIVSSPSTTGSWVYNYVRQADDVDTDIAVIQCPSTANPTISPSEIERLQNTKNELEFRAEVLGEWVDGAYGLFNGMIESNKLEADADPPPPGAVYALGADLALSYSHAHDRNALAVVAKWFPPDSMDELEARYRVMDIQILDRASDREIRTACKRLIKQYGIQYAAVEQFQGKALAEYCQAQAIDTRLLAATSGMQQTLFHDMHCLLRQTLIELPKNLPQLFFDELRSFEYRREPNGRVSFGHPHTSRMHDDTVYAVAWAVYATGFERSADPPRISIPYIDFIEQT